MGIEGFSSSVYNRGVTGKTEVIVGAKIQGFTLFGRNPGSLGRGDDPLTLPQASLFN
jgi:hypothetical protein